uniref:Uncharacterized protein n=1 Tax=Leersia perrieri TaxID=77586 RepID=A0A0D9V0B6_9ORYZ
MQIDTGGLGSTTTIRTVAGNLFHHRAPGLGTTTSSVRRIQIDDDELAATLNHDTGGHGSTTSCSAVEQIEPPPLILALTA